MTEYDDVIQSLERITDKLSALISSANAATARPTIRDVDLLWRSHEALQAVVAGNREMAGRILATIAFLSAAAAVMYDATAPDDGFSLSTLPFTGFLFFIFLATVFYLSALWPPRLSLPKGTPAGAKDTAAKTNAHEPGGEGASLHTKSVPFATLHLKDMSEVENWEAFVEDFPGRTDSLFAGFILRERPYLQGIAHATARYLQYGAICLIMALFSFIWLLATLFTNDLHESLALSSAGGSVLCLVLAIASWVRHPDKAWLERLWAWIWVATCVLLLIATVRLGFVDIAFEKMAERQPATSHMILPFFKAKIGGR